MYQWARAGAMRAQARSSRAAQPAGNSAVNQTLAVIPNGKAMRGALRARPARMMREAPAALIRNGFGCAVCADMRLVT